MEPLTGLLLLAALLIGISKGGIPAAGALAVPMVSFWMNPLAAAALLLPIFLVMDWFAVWTYRREYSAANVKILLPSVLAGIAFAAVAAPFLHEQALLILTGLIGLWYCVRRLITRTQTVSEPQPIAGAFWGVLTGISTFITHSGAAPLQAYLLPQRLPGLVFAGTAAIVFAVGNLAKLPAYASAGLLKEVEIAQIASLFLIGFAGVAIGRKIVKTLPEQTYRTLLEIMLFILSITLLLRGVGVL